MGGGLGEATVVVVRGVAALEGLLALASKRESPSGCISVFEEGGGRARGEDTVTREGPLTEVSKGTGEPGGV